MRNKNNFVFLFLFLKHGVEKIRSYLLVSRVIVYLLAGAGHEEKPQRGDELLL